MPKIQVLDVPEFAGLVTYARTARNVRVSSPRNGYVTIASDDDLVFDRRVCGFKPAVWYSCCSGGVDGQIVEFGRDTLRIRASVRA